jgi:hypothetical protein
MTDKKTENKLRRALGKAGYMLHKASGMIGADNLGGYMICDLYNNAVVCGSRFELDLDDVADWLEHLASEDE